MGVRAIRIWRIRGGELRLGGRTLIMGILNVTPDSFSDGGLYTDPSAAVEHALHMEREGADIIDIGAESTRPGSQPVPSDEQLKRLRPVLSGLRKRTRLPISVDTTHHDVARISLEAGADVINDVSGLSNDAGVARVCNEFGAGLVLMHMRGTPATMQQDTTYGDLIGEVRAALVESVERAKAAGLSHEHCIVDPGLGFGKDFTQNHRLIANLQCFAGVCAGVLAGPSRKGFTGETSKLPPEQRQFATAAAVALCVLNGADIVRVHDVRAMREVAEFVDRHRAAISSDVN